MTYEQPRADRRTFLKSLALGGAACLINDVPAGAARDRKLPRTSPESVGTSPAAIMAFVDAVEQKVGGLHSLMLLRHGKVAAEGWWSPYAPQRPHMLYSLSKSFTSTAVGLAIADGRLTLDAPVVSFFPGDLPATVGDNLAAMQVRHLLMMSTGHDKDATGPTTAAPDGNWVKQFLSLPVEHAPGSKFVYNSAATYMLSAIVQKRIGMTVLDYLKPRLFGPLGIEGETWETCPRGINTGGWGLSVKTEDIARFGQLYLQHGALDGRQIVPQAWVEQATSKQISNGTAENSDWSQGYGFQFWRCRHGAFRGDGAFGQFCVVMLQQDAVLAITSGVGDMQAVLNAAWDHLLPGMQPDSILADSASSDLKHKLAGLIVRAPEGKPTSPTAERVSGHTYRFDTNVQKIQSVALTFGGDRCTAVTQTDHGEQRIECGNAAWMKGIAPPGAPAPGPVAARGAWTDADTYTVKLCFYETPFIETIAYKFAGDQVTLTSKMNVGFGPTERPPLVGRLA